MACVIIKDYCGKTCDLPMCKDCGCEKPNKISHTHVQPKTNENCTVEHVHVHTHEEETEEHTHSHEEK